MQKRIPPLIIIFSFIIWILTEGLSLFHILTPRIVSIVWEIIILLIILFYCSRKYKIINFKNFLIMKSHSCIDWGSNIVLLCCIILGCCTLFFSYIIVPNNWDSMTYHLPRVAHWIQNGTVAYYPTNISRQLYYSSFTEYIILHMCLLLKNDHLVNLIQWGAYILCSFMIYRIAKELELDRIIALFSVLFFMLSPLPIAESTTTQVDLMGTLWVLIFMYYIILIGKSDKRLCHRETIKNILYCASSIGFGYLTKASICFAMPVFLVWLFIICIKKQESIGSMFVCSLVAISVILMLAFPGFIRNYKATGDILAIEEMGNNLMIKTADPKMLLLNSCKNLAMEVGEDNPKGVTWTICMKMARILGIDIEAPEISAYSGFSEGIPLKYDHDRAGARVLILTSISLFIVFLFMKKDNIKSLYIGYIVSSLLAVGCLFSCIRWQPWVTRLLLPTLPILSIFCAFTINKLCKDHRGWVLLLSILILIIPDTYKTMDNLYKYAEPALDNQDRFYLYFLNRGEATEYEALCDEIVQMGERGKNIGLLLDGDTYEWPLWIKLKTSSTTLKHILLEEDNIVWYPGCIAAINRDVRVGEILQYGNEKYICTWNYQNDSRFALLIRM